MDPNTIIASKALRHKVEERKCACCDSDGDKVDGTPGGTPEQESPAPSPPASQDPTVVSMEYLKDEDGRIFVPRTHTKAVQNAKGDVLDDILVEHERRLSLIESTLDISASPEQCPCEPSCPETGNGQGTTGTPDDAPIENEGEDGTGDSSSPDAGIPIRWITNGGKKIYPLTHADAVIDDAGNKMSSVMAACQEQIDSCASRIEEVERQVQEGGSCQCPIFEEVANVEDEVFEPSSTMSEEIARQGREIESLKSALQELTSTYESRIAALEAKIISLASISDTSSYTDNL